jgi:hypothetical protein
MLSIRSGTVKDAPLLPFKIRAFSWKTSSPDRGFGDRVLGGRYWHVLLELRKKLTVSESCSTYSIGIMERSSSIEGWVLHFWTTRKRLPQAKTLTSPHERGAVVFNHNTVVNAWRLEEWNCCGNKYFLAFPYSHQFLSFSAKRDAA